MCGRTSVSIVDKERRGKMFWVWIGGAFIAGGCLGILMMCLMIWVCQGEDFKDGILRKRPKNLAECDPKRRILALSIERVK